MDFIVKIWILSQKYGILLIFRREISYEEGETFAKKNNLFFFEISAKSSHNLQAAFLKLSEIILNKIENHEINPNNEVISSKNPPYFPIISQSLGIKKGNREDKSQQQSSRFLITSGNDEETRKISIGNHKIAKCCPLN